MSIVPSGRPMVTWPARRPVVVRLHEDPESSASSASEEAPRAWAERIALEVRRYAIGAVMGASPFPDRLPSALYALIIQS